MKAFVITVDHPKSHESADKCIESCAKQGIHVEKFNAITPKDNPREIIRNITGNTKGMLLDLQPFPERVAACFASQLTLWDMCSKDSEPYLILEHDAVLELPFPHDLEFDRCITLGRPSWGPYLDSPQTLSKKYNEGVNKLRSHCFIGNHAILIKPEGARDIIEKAGIVPVEPADTFLSNHYFTFLEEYFPWPFVVRETFSMIQGDASGDGKANTLHVKNNIDLWTYEVIDPDENIHNNN
jgi:GR25 family glycosyltransferase involved in LPS biosynthesis